MKKITLHQYCTNTILPFCIFLVPFSTTVSYCIYNVRKITKHVCTSACLHVSIFYISRHAWHVRHPGILAVFPIRPYPTSCRIDPAVSHPPQWRNPWVWPSVECYTLECPGPKRSVHDHTTGRVEFPLRPCFFTEPKICSWIKIQHKTCTILALKSSLYLGKKIDSPERATERRVLGTYQIYHQNSYCRGMHPMGPSDEKGRDKSSRHSPFVRLKFSYMKPSVLFCG
jgi:hypothetical protein